MTERASAIGSPLRTATAVRNCSSSPQKTVFPRIALRSVDNAYAIARMTTKPISPVKRSI